MFFGNDKLEKEIEDKNGLIESLRHELRSVKMKFQEEIKSQRREITSLNEMLESLKGEHEKYVKKVEENISIDLESGAHNQRYFYDTVESVISLAKRNKTALSIAVVYVDGIDRLGNRRAEENQILQIIIRKISSQIRESDIFVKLDAGKFALVFPQTSLNQARQVCKKLHENISQKPIVDELYLGLNAGVTEFLENESVNSALKRAEELLRAS